MGRYYPNTDTEASTSAEYLRKKKRGNFSKKYEVDTDHSHEQNKRRHNKHKSPKRKEVEDKRKRKKHSFYTEEKVIACARRSRSYCQVNYDQSNKTKLRGILKHHSQNRRQLDYDGEEFEIRRPRERYAKYDYEESLKDGSFVRTASSEEEHSRRSLARRGPPKRPKYLLGHVARTTGPTPGWGGGVALIIRKRNKNEHPDFPRAPGGWFSLFRSGRCVGTDDEELAR